MLAKRRNLRTLAFFVAVGFLLTPATLATAQDPSGRPPDKRPGGKKPGTRPTTRPPRPDYGPPTVMLVVLTEPPESEVLINGEARGTTDAEGRAKFEKLPLGSYSIEVRKAGYTSAARGFQAGVESPTLKFTLVKNLDAESKQFNDLLAAGKLNGPDPPNALDYYKEIAAQYPGRPETARMRGDLSNALAAKLPPLLEKTSTRFRQVRREELTQGLEVTAAVLALKPDDRRAQAEAAYLRGLVALRDALAGAGPEGGENPGGLAVAIAELNQALQLRPDWAEANYHYGYVLLRTGNAAGAEAAYAKVTQLEPRRADGLTGLGMAQHAAGKHKEAIDTFRRALTLESGSAAANAGLGVALLAKGDEKDGVKSLQRAAQLDPRSGLPNYYLGQHYARSKKSKERQQAAAELRAAIQKNTDNFEFSNQAAQRLLDSLPKK